MTKQPLLTRAFWRLSLYAPRRLGYWLNHQATKRWVGCPECGSTKGCPARPDDPVNPLPRWEDDKVRERLGLATEGRCPNCGAGWPR